MAEKKTTERKAAAKASKTGTAAKKAKSPKTDKTTRTGTAVKTAKAKAAKAKAAKAVKKVEEAVLEVREEAKLKDRLNTVLEYDLHTTPEEASAQQMYKALARVVNEQLRQRYIDFKKTKEKAEQMRREFTANVSHELKTPLAAMSGYAQNAEMELANGGNTVLIQEKLKRISSESNRMALMVTQILDATRIEEGRMVLERTPCDIESLVRETIDDDPVLLLDDVFSELDASRQKYLIDCIRDVQTVVTCTGMDEFIDNRLRIDCIYNVAAGSITKREELHE